MWSTTSVRPRPGRPRSVARTPSRPGDVLVAVMEVYGEDFDHVLRVHGTDRSEVVQRLSLQAA